MNPEDDEAQKALPILVPPLLDSFGVAELSGYIAALEAEIARVKAAISAKSAHRAAAALFFRQPPPPEGDA